MVCDFLSAHWFNVNLVVGARVERVQSHQADFSKQQKISLEYPFFLKRHSSVLGAPSYILFYTSQVDIVFGTNTPPTTCGDICAQMFGF